jgi:glycosyltransferase involved in cell wall biosynthesis
MHIVATARRRGGELFASSLVAALAGDGIDQLVQVLRPGDDDPVTFAAPVVRSSKGAVLPGVRTDVRTIVSLRGTMRSFRPEVIQAHGGEALKHALAAAAGDGRRIVYRRIGDAAQFGGSRLRERAYAGLMRRSARVVAVSEAQRRQLLERFGLSPSRVVTIPNGVDLAALRPIRSRPEVRAALQITEDAPVVLSLGALTWEKDPVAHVRVVAEIARTHPKIVHVMAGDGPLRSEVEHAVRRLNAEVRTRLLGVRDDVADLLGASDVMLLASRTEGMPASVIEAGASGVPVIAYALSGIPEAVLDGETGLLVRPGDEPALARALGELLADDEHRAALGERAAVWSRERFDIGIVARRYVEVYERFAARTPKRSVSIR